MARPACVEWGRVGSGLGSGAPAAGGGGGSSSRCCSYKRTTVVICCLNLIAALYVCRSLYTSYYMYSLSASASSTASKYTDDQIKKMSDSVRIRQALKPTELIRVARKVERELARNEKRWEFTLQMKQKLAGEALQRMRDLGDNASTDQQLEALQEWKNEKLQQVKKLTSENILFNSTISMQEAKNLRRALKSDLHLLLEDIGLWIPRPVVNKDPVETDEELDDEEEEIIAGPAMPRECHAELHTDYDGIAVRWGLTHHKESAAACCQACLDQAKNAKPGQMKCNIWVYCPSEGGCYSPDKYEHRHQECWLKQAGHPKLNFKSKYSEAYRSVHPNAPLIVPWMSGVIGS